MKLVPVQLRRRRSDGFSAQRNDEEVEEAEEQDHVQLEKQGEPTLAQSVDLHDEEEELEQEKGDKEKDYNITTPPSVLRPLRSARMQWTTSTSTKSRARNKMIMLKDDENKEEDDREDEESRHAEGGNTDREDEEDEIVALQKKISAASSFLRSQHSTSSIQWIKIQEEEEEEDEEDEKASDDNQLERVPPKDDQESPLNDSVQDTCLDNNKGRRAAEEPSDSEDAAGTTEQSNQRKKKGWIKLSKAKMGFGKKQKDETEGGVVDDCGEPAPMLLEAREQEEEQSPEELLQEQGLKSGASAIDLKQKKKRWITLRKSNCGGKTEHEHDAESDHCGDKEKHGDKEGYDSRSNNTEEEEDVVGNDDFSEARFAAAWLRSAMKLLKAKMQKQTKELASGGEENDATCEDPRDDNNKVEEGEIPKESLESRIAAAVMIQALKQSLKKLRGPRGRKTKREEEEQNEDDDSSELLGEVIPLEEEEARKDDAKETGFSGALVAGPMTTHMEKLPLMNLNSFMQMGIKFPDGKRNGKKKKFGVLHTFESALAATLAISLKLRRALLNKAKKVKIVKGAKLSDQDDWDKYTNTDSSESFNDEYAAPKRGLDVSSSKFPKDFTTFEDYPSLNVDDVSWVPQGEDETFANARKNFKVIVEQDEKADCTLSKDEEEALYTAIEILQDLSRDAEDRQKLADLERHFASLKLHLLDTETKLNQLVKKKSPQSDTDFFPLDPHSMMQSFLRAHTTPSEQARLANLQRMMEAALPGSARQVPPLVNELDLMVDELDLIASLDEALDAAQEEASSFTSAQQSEFEDSVYSYYYQEKLPVCRACTELGHNIDKAAGFLLLDWMSSMVENANVYDSWAPAPAIAHENEI